MEQDRADRLTDQVEARTLAACESLYAQALRNALRRGGLVFEKLKSLESQKPPSVYQTESQQDAWRESERRRIIRQSGIANLIAREVAAAGAQAAVLIRRSMDEVDRINREAEDIG